VGQNHKSVNRKWYLHKRIRGWRNRKQPVTERQTENMTAQIKNWCKFPRGVSANRRKTRAGFVYCY